MNLRTLALHACIASSLAAAPALAADPASSKDPMASMSAEEKAMIESYMKAAAPGPMHELLKSSVGSFDMVIKNWMAPGAPPQASKATATRRVAYGGRYVIEEAKGESMMPGQPPFEGMGINGYDNVSKQFFSTWIDSMGTGMMTSTGTYDAKSKTFNYQGSYNDPMTGKAKTIRMVVKDIDPTHSVFEMYDKAPDGKEFMNMEITYTRK